MIPHFGEAQAKQKTVAARPKGSPGIIITEWLMECGKHREIGGGSSWALSGIFRGDLLGGVADGACAAGSARSGCRACAQLGRGFYRTIRNPKGSGSEPPYVLPNFSPAFHRPLRYNNPGDPSGRAMSRYGIGRAEITPFDSCPPPTQTNCHPRAAFFLQTPVSKSTTFF